MIRTYVLLFLALLAFWFVLSDQHSPLFVALGVASALAVTVVTAPLVISVVGEVRRTPGELAAQAWYFGVYLGWLLWRILVSALQVAWVVVNPKVPPEPRMLRFRTNMHSHLARVMLANTITLVPGTLTVRLDGDSYLVHALIPEAAEDLLDGRMQTRIARIFHEAPEVAIDPRWEEPLVIEGEEHG